MFSVSVVINEPVRGHGSSVRFNASVSSRGTLVDILRQMRERSGASNGSAYRLISSPKVLHRLTPGCAIPSGSSLVVTGVAPGHDLAGGQPTVYHVDEGTERLKFPSIQLHETTCLPYVPGGLEFEALPEIKFVSFATWTDLFSNPPVTFEIPSDRIKGPQHLYPQFKSHAPSIQDLLDIFLVMLGSNESKPSGYGLRLEVENSDAAVNICSVFEAKDSVLQEKLRDLELPGPTISARLEKQFPVSVKTMTGKTISLFVFSQLTTNEVKTLVQDKEGIPPDQQRLLCSGVQLEGHMMLKDYDIGPNSVMSLVLNLRGGMFHESSGRNDMQPLLKEPGESKTEVTIHFDNGFSKKLVGFVGHDQVMDAVNETVRQMRNKRKPHEESAEERVARLRAELELAEAQLESDSL